MFSEELKGKRSCRWGARLNPQTKPNRASSPKKTREEKEAPQLKTKKKRNEKRCRGKESRGEVRKEKKKDETNVSLLNASKRDRQESLKSGGVIKNKPSKKGPPQ